MDIVELLKSRGASLFLNGGSGMLTNTTVEIVQPAATSINISAGFGFISDNLSNGDVNNKKIKWEAETVAVPVSILNLDGAFYITKDENGQTKFYPFPIDSEIITREIFISTGGATGGIVTVLGQGNFGGSSQHVAQTVAQMFLEYGPVLKGVVIEKNAVNLSIDISTGKEFFYGNNWRFDRNNPNFFPYAGEDAPTINYQYMDPARTTGWNISAQAQLDPTRWDDGSATLPLVSSSQPWTIQPFWISVTTGVILANYGQATYKTLAEALAALASAQELASPTVTNLPRLGWLVVNKNHTTSSQTTYVRETFRGNTILGSDIATLQDGYLNRLNVFDIITDATRMAVRFRRGSAADTDNIFEGQNGAGAVTSSIKGNGAIEGTTVKNTAAPVAVAVDADKFHFQDVSDSENVKHITLSNLSNTINSGSAKFKSSIATGVDSTSIVAIPFENESFRDPEITNTSSTVKTISKAGRYRIAFSASVSATTNNYKWAGQCGIRKNGVDILATRKSGFLDGNEGAFTTGIGIDETFDLAFNDTIEILVRKVSTKTGDAALIPDEIKLEIIKIK